MQTHATAGIILTAILAIAHNWMTDVSHVDANLVLAPCEKMQEQHGTLRSLLHELPLGGSPFPSVINRTAHDKHAFSIMQPTLNPSLRLFHDTIYHSDITAVDDG